VIKQMGEFMESFSAGILLGRVSDPADLTGMTTFLASADSDYITGQCIVCDGGMVMF
jgi:meso-butanediol dehydrogenase / (S,S)-butanediol dehydrogenase / diacetyl reductase